MFLPYETTLSLWFSPSAVYDWEPEPLAVEAAKDSVGAEPGTLAGTRPDGAASCMPVGLPAMRLVFKGVKWTAYPVYGLRENPAWEQASQTRREVDEDQRDDKLRETRKSRSPAPQAKPD